VTSVLSVSPQAGVVRPLFALLWRRCAASLRSRAQQEMIWVAAAVSDPAYSDVVAGERRRRRKAMLEFINSPADVLAVKLTGTITGKDLDAILDRVEGVIGKPGKINFYVETRGIEGIELAALPHHFSRSFPLFEQAKRFGRVAVVADQAWMRVLTRFESALLPYVSYRVFEPGERKEALDFAFGKQLVPA
jgi:hypothetical protein